MEKLSLLFQLFRKGSEVSNPEKWKQHQIDANAVGGIILLIAALLKTFFDIHLPMDDATALSIGGGIIAMVNVGLTAITSKRAGLLPAKPVEPVASQPVPTSFDPAQFDLSEREQLSRPGSEPDTARSVAIPDDTSQDIAEIQVRTVRRRKPELPKVDEPAKGVQSELPSTTKPAKPGDTYFG